MTTYKIIIATVDIVSVIPQDEVMGDDLALEIDFDTCQDAVEFATALKNRIVQSCNQSAAESLSEF